MQCFTTLIGIAAPIPIANIDTDYILSARFLKTVSRAGLGKGLMYAARFDGHGKERPEFILNREPWRHAQIIVALDNFGCGSSREHAPWALKDFGIRCVIAPSFADIFYNNCFKNGILPIIMPHPTVYQMLKRAARPESAIFTIDLLQRKIEVSNAVFTFEIEGRQRDRLIHGIDDVRRTLDLQSDIDRYEAANAAVRPWLSDLTSTNNLFSILNG